MSAREPSDAADLAAMTPFWRQYFRRQDADRSRMMDRTISVDLTERELHVLTCAMAGNFPPKLNDVRMPTLRKLARASRTLREAARPQDGER
jgi:hypothetical protein